MAAYLVVKCNSTSNKSISLSESEPPKPYMQIKNGGYLPLTTETTTAPQRVMVKAQGSAWLVAESKTSTMTYTTTSQVNTTSSSTYTLSSTTWQWAQQGNDSGVNGRECGAAVWFTLQSQLSNLQTGPYGYNCTLYGWLTMAAFVTQGSWYVPFPIWAGFLTANGILATYWQRGGPAGANYNFMWTDDAAISYPALGAGLAALNSVLLTASIGGASESPAGASGGYITVGYGTNTAQVTRSTQAYRTSAAYNNAVALAPASAGGNVYYADVGGGRNWSGTTSSMSSYTQPSPALTSNYSTTSEETVTETATVTY